MEPLVVSIPVEVFLYFLRASLNIDLVSRNLFLLGYVIKLDCLYFVFFLSSVHL